MEVVDASGGHLRQWPISQGQRITPARMAERTYRAGPPVGVHNIPGREGHCTSSTITMGSEYSSLSGFSRSCDFTTSVVTSALEGALEYARHELTSPAHLPRALPLRAP